MLKALLLTVILSLPHLALSQEIDASKNERDLLIYDESKVDGITQQQQLLIEYDGSLIDVEKDIPADKASLLALTAADATTEELELLNKLSDTELQIFLRKKETFTRRFAKTLRFFKLKEGWIAKAISEINSQFYRSSKLIANSNTKGGTFMLSVGGGLALPEKAVKALKNKPLGRFIPDSGGFYYMLGLGAGVVRKVDPSTKKSQLYFELFIDTEKLKTTMTGLVEATAAATLGVVYEHRPDDFWVQKKDVLYGGAAGLFRRGENHFGWAGSLGASAPPMIGMFLIYQDEAIRRYFFRLNLTKIFVEVPGEIFANLTGRIKSLRARSCSRIY